MGPNQWRKFHKRDSGEVTDSHRMAHAGTPYSSFPASLRKELVILLWSINCKKPLRFSLLTQSCQQLVVSSVPKSKCGPEHHGLLGNTSIVVKRNQGKALWTFIRRPDLYGEYLKNKWFFFLNKNALKTRKEIKSLQNPLHYEPTETWTFKSCTINQALWHLKQILESIPAEMTSCFLLPFMSHFLHINVKGRWHHFLLGGWEYKCRLCRL